MLTISYDTASMGSLIQIISDSNRFYFWLPASRHLCEILTAILLDFNRLVIPVVVKGKHAGLFEDSPICYKCSVCGYYELELGVKWEESGTASVINNRFMLA